tara:strand:- start:4713 stop:4985 length:273 start_codon:yes stop_codon:yes gene_type:complete
MIPDYGNPAVDLLIDKLNCTEVYTKMTPSEKKTQEDEVFKEIIALRKRVIGMSYSFGLHPSQFEAEIQGVVAYESFLSSYVQFIYKEVHK